MPNVKFDGKCLITSPNSTFFFLFFSCCLFVLKILSCIARCPLCFCSSSALQPRASWLLREAGKLRWGSLEKGYNFNIIFVVYSPATEATGCGFSLMQTSKWWVQESPGRNHVFSLSKQLPHFKIFFSLSCFLSYLSTEQCGYCRACRIFSRHKEPVLLTVHRCDE